MKKLVIAALAIASMVACTKSNVQYEQPGEISLQPVAQKATKATFQGEVYPNDEAFNVWAWWIDPNNSSNVTDYISEGTFKFNEVHQTWAGWNGTQHYPYYWPTLGSLRFAGYSPAAAKKEGTTFGYNIGTKTFTVRGYKQSSKINETVDLMWFDLTEPFTGNGTKGVPVVFRHALSWLTFKFYLKESTTPEYWTIKSVVLKGIETTANFTVINKIPNWDTPTNEATEGITVYSDDTGHVVKNTYASADDAILEKTPNGVLIIPQSCAPSNGTNPADAELVITYDLKSPTGQILTDQNVSLPLNGTNINNKWEPGKHYTYNITFGASEILIAPSVTGWTEIDIPVEK